MFQKIPQTNAELWIVTYLTAIRAGQAIKFATTVADECLAEFNFRTFALGPLDPPVTRKQ